MTPSAPLARGKAASITSSVRLSLLSLSGNLIRHMSEILDVVSVPFFLLLLFRSVGLSMAFLRRQFKQFLPLLSSEGWPSERRRGRSRLFGTGTRVGCPSHVPLTRSRSAPMRLQAPPWPGAPEVRWLLGFLSGEEGVSCTLSPSSFLHLCGSEQVCITKRWKTWMIAGE